MLTSDVFPAGSVVLFLFFCFCFLMLYITTLPPHKTTLLSRRKYVLPPGPKGAPVIGSLLEWLQVRRSRTLVPWLTKQSRYGEMTTLSMGTKTWVLLNSDRVVNEIIAKRATKTHERPYFPIASELISRSKRLFLQKTKDWKEGRLLLSQLFLGAASKGHDAIVEEASVDLLRAYLEHPKEWYAHNYRYAVSIVYQIVTNAPLQKPTSDLDNLQRVTSTFLTAINSSLVEFFPYLARIPIPLQFWRPYWEKVGTFHYQVFKNWWVDIKAHDNPLVSPSFVGDILPKKYSGTEEQAMYLSMLAINAGADNPRMVMNAWVMAALSYPDKMELARKEVESVCGDALRLPGLADLPRMPYMSAMVKEVLRWRPTVPLIPQRVLVEDLEFEGFSFPKGTEFLVNSVAVCSNGYEKPEKFDPERWFKNQAEEEKITQSLWQFAFSAGMRSCVGYKLAQKELFVAFSRLIYCFEFVPAGKFDDTVLNAFELGEPFPVDVRIRSQKYKQLIQRSYLQVDNKEKGLG